MGDLVGTGTYSNVVRMLPHQLPVTYPFTSMRAHHEALSFLIDAVLLHFSNG